MGTREISYPTELEAKAFKDGVEFVNDSAINVLGIESRKDQGWIVVIDDEDFHEAEDSAE